MPNEMKPLFAAIFLENAAELFSEMPNTVEACQIAASILRKVESGEMVEVNRWVPVTERLPKPETSVLIMSEFCETAPYANITIGHLHQMGDLRYKPYWAWIAYGQDMVSPKIEAFHRAEFICPGSEYVTHWMPLPEPPEMDGVK